MNPPPSLFPNASTYMYVYSKISSPSSSSCLLPSPTRQTPSVRFLPTYQPNGRVAQETTTLEPS